MAVSSLTVNNIVDDLKTRQQLVKMFLFCILCMQQSVVFTVIQGLTFYIMHISKYNFTQIYKAL